MNIMETCCEVNSVKLIQDKFQWIKGLDYITEWLYLTMPA
jgi:hypothetical protein